MARVHWKPLHRDNHPPEGVPVLVYGHRSPDLGPMEVAGPSGPEISVDTLRNAPDGFDEFEAVSHWCPVEEIEPPEGY